MKTLAISLITCNVLLASTYTIQLISVKNSASITNGFMRMVERVGLEYALFKEDGYKKVTVGSFPTREAARVTCKELSCIPKDAFVRKVPLDIEKPEVIETEEENISIELESVSETEAETLLAPKCEPCSVIHDPKALHKQNIAEALEYFRSSGYYTFSGPN